MSLSDELISLFAKTTNDGSTAKSETTVYGTIVEYEGDKYVKLDGSELLTPIITTVDAEPGERVTVLIKNHSATVTGNISSPAARTDTVREIGTKIDEFEIIVAGKVDTVELNAVIGRIDTLTSDNVTIKQKLTAYDADITNLKADNATITGKLEAAEADIDKLVAEDVTITGKIEAVEADIEKLETDNLTINQKLTANIADIEHLYAENVDINNKLTANIAEIERLEAQKLSATDADFKYANIDFTNIGKAAMEYLYAESGLIKNVTVGDQTITGELVGVTIKGDLIEANTLKADRLVVLGEDGLYYKLNFNHGTFAEGEPIPTDSLHGSVITANSITAEKISVKDLVAFDATIGGFKITTKSIYSGVKESVDNTTQGIYMDNEGQLALGDSNEYLKYYKDAEGKCRLEISASSLIMSSSNKTIETFVKEATDFEIGGKNILLNTKTFEGDNIRLVSQGHISGLYKDNLNIYSCDYSSATSGYIDFIQFSRIYPEKLGATYTLSFYAKGSGRLRTFFHGNTGYLTCAKVVQSNGNTGTMGDGNSEWVLTDEWTRYWVTWTLSATGDISIEKYVLFRLFYGSTASICGCKLELGDKATDWTPAPEDVDNMINDIEVGGRNYVLNSSGKEQKGFFENFSSVGSDGYCTHTLVSQKKYAFINIANGFVLGCRDYNVGSTVMFSYDIMFTEWNFPEGSNRQEWWFGQRYASQTISGGSTSGAWVGVTSHALPVVGENGCILNEWYRVEKTFTMPKQAAEGISTESKIQLYNSNENVEASVTFKIRNVKVEYGNKATDWMPAPEDIDQDILDTEERVHTVITEKETSIIKNAEDIILQALGSYTLKNGGLTVASVTNYYIASDSETGVDILTDGWTTEIPTLSSSAPYLFAYEVVTYIDDSTVTTAPRLILTYGSSVVNNISEYYASHTDDELPAKYDNGLEWDGNTNGLYAVDSDYGRNLVIGSNVYRQDTPFTNTSSSVDGSKLEQTMYMSCKPGETYTIQCCTDGIWGNHATDGSGAGWTHIFLYLMTDDNTIGQYVTPVALMNNPSDGLTGRQTWTYTIPVNGNAYTKMMFRFDIHSDGSTVYTVNWWDLKVEKGSVATPWTPAPEDIDQTISSTADYYKITDQVLSNVELGKDCDVTYTDEGTIVTSTFNVDMIDFEETYTLLNKYIVSIFEDGVIVGSRYFPTKGTYFANDSSDNLTVEKIYVAGDPMFKTNTDSLTWSDKLPEITVSTQYLWHYENLTLADGSVIETDKRLIASYQQSFNELVETVRSQLKVMSDEISMNFTTAIKNTNHVNGELQSFMTTFSKYIKFTGETAITIGSGDSAITLEIDNDTGIVFKKNGVQFGSWDGINFHTGNIVVKVDERAQFGNFAFVPRSDGSLMFLKVGG